MLVKGTPGVNELPITYIIVRHYNIEGITMVVQNTVHIFEMGRGMFTPCQVGDAVFGSVEEIIGVDWKNRPNNIFTYEAFCANINTCVNLFEET